MPSVGSLGRGGGVSGVPRLNPKPSRGVKGAREREEGGGGQLLIERIGQEDCPRGERVRSAVVALLSPTLLLVIPILPSSFERRLALVAGHQRSRQGSRAPHYHGPEKDASELCFRTCMACDRSISTFLVQILHANENQGPPHTGLTR